jgi:tetratricopeptide (TPR) repeat protein
VDDWLEFDLQVALFFAGRAQEGLARARALAEQAEAQDDAVGALVWRLHETVFLLYLEPEGAAEQVAALLDLAPSLPVAGREFALFMLDWGRAQLAHMLSRFDDALEARERSVEAARRLERQHLVALFAPGIANALLFGSGRPEEVIAAIDAVESGGPTNRQLMAMRAQALAMLGQFDEARALLDRVQAELAERGATVPRGLHLAHSSVDIELLAGNLGKAVEDGENGCRLLEEAGQVSWLSTAEGKLAQAHYMLGELDRAEAMAARAAEHGAKEDAITQMLWRQVRAKVLARRGDLAEAELLAREAVAIGDASHMLDAVGDAYADLGEVRALAGDRAGEISALGEAAARFERKGNIVSAAHVRERLAALEKAEAPA